MQNLPNFRKKIKLYNHVYVCVCVCMRVWGGQSAPRNSATIALYIPHLDPSQVFLFHGALHKVVGETCCSRWIPREQQ